MQGELFHISGPVIDASRESQASSRWIDRFQLTLRLDHLLIGGIFALVLYVLIFSFGVEKGKRYVTAELKAEKARQELMAQQIAQPPTTPTVTSSVSPQKTTPETPVPQETTTILAQPLAGRYTIQLITFKSQKRADEEVERLKKAGYQAFIISQGNFFQVCADAFQNVGEARQKLSQLKAEGFAPPDAYIRPVGSIKTV